jgi:glutamyl-tRNA reductase
VKPPASMSKDEFELQPGAALINQRVAENDERANGFVCDDLPRDAAWVEKFSCDEAELGTEGAALPEPSPTIIALKQRLEQIRSAEVERYRSKLGSLEPAQHRAVEALTRGILTRVLNGPVSELKAHTGAPEQHVRAQLVRRIFGLA